MNKRPRVKRGTISHDILTVSTWAAEDNKLITQTSRKIKIIFILIKSLKIIIINVLKYMSKFL